jgi:Tol biopolymer transport system component/DNA-binding winged helix-turn-helix (wHTH) protein
MGDQVPPERSIQVGAFVVNLRSGEVRKNGRRILLPDQPFKVLAVLLRQPGRVVTRAELHAELWPQDTFVDYEHGLNSALARLRASLNDSAERSAYIETVGGRGYRLIARVQELDQEGGSDSPIFAATRAPAMTTATAGAVASRKKFVGLRSNYRIALLALFVAVTGAVWLHFSRRQAAALPPPKVVPLTSFPDRAECESFSPNGDEIAFARHSDSPGVSGIYIKQIGEDQLLQLTRSATDWCPTWSPDGRYIAFSRYSNYGKEEQAILIVSAIGGAERRLRFGQPAHSPLGWSPDGKFIAFTARDSDRGTFGISLLNVESLEERKLTDPTTQHQDWGPAFSPDGRQLAFVRSNGGYASAAEIFTMPANGGTARRLTFDNTEIGPPAWTPDGLSILFSSARGGLPAIWRIAVSGGPPVQVAQAGVPSLRPAVAPNGHRLAYEQAMHSSSLWSLSIPERANSGSPKRVTASKGRNWEAELSPDGLKILFVSNRSGNDEIYICDKDGSNLVRLTNLAATTAIGSPRWSPDSQKLVFDSLLEGHNAIFVIKAVGGLPNPLLHDGFENVNASWSRDGTSIYFTSNRSGQWQIWKMPSEGGEPVRMTRGGGFAAFESADGKSIYYTKGPSDQDIWKMRLVDRQEAAISPQVHTQNWTGWALTDKGILFARQGPVAHGVLRFFDFATARVHEIAPLEKQGWPLWISASADGKFVLYRQVDLAVNNIMMLENFR